MADRKPAGVTRLYGRFPTKAGYKRQTNSVAASMQTLLAIPGLRQGLPFGHSLASKAMQQATACQARVYKILAQSSARVRSF